MEDFNFKDLQEAGNRYLLDYCMGEGVYGSVFQASDTQAGNKKVAIKIQIYNDETRPFIEQEYRILRNFTKHENLVEFYGIFKHCKGDQMEVWFVMELCEGGPVTDLVNGLIANNRRMSEEHIAFILKELAKVLVYLHDNNILHRDIKGSNILLTKNGEIKLVDFGLSRLLKGELEKTNTCLGSPSWMAPEVVTATAKSEDGYDNRADVWSTGIVAIELGNGEPPFQNMHPTRALFQIVRNPPPKLNKPANWSELYNDFISECLVKNPENRAVMMELMEHPFLTSVPEKTYHLCQELKFLSEEFSKSGKEFRSKERTVHSNFIKEHNTPLKPMNVEDLAALNKLSESIVLDELSARMEEGQSCTFVGDVLLVLNPNEKQDIYNESHQNRYKFQSRSDNAAHVYSIADSAYQAALHHESVQHIVLSGESGSGKTTNFLHILDQLLYLGQTNNINQMRIKNGLSLIQSLVHASTPVHDNSTRCVLRTEITYGDAGKNTGAYFEVNQIEKWRVSSTDMSQSNFHILYYFYDGIFAKGELNKYLLDDDRKYRYLRTSPDVIKNGPASSNSPENIKAFQTILTTFEEFEFCENQIQSILNIFSAVLNLGDIKFFQSDNKVEIESEKYAANVAELLGIDKKKFIWALKNYCVLQGGTVVRRKNSCEEARDSRDVLANVLYCRVVEYIVETINHQLSYGRSIFGDKFSVKIMDLYGFECFSQNHYPQLLINCINEQLHFHYLQRIFCWEDLETNEEDIPYKPIYYYNNKNALNELLSSSGVLSQIDITTKESKNYKFLIDRLKQTNRMYVHVQENSEFSVNHFTGKVVYQSKEMAETNREFLPADIIEVLRSSNIAIVKSLFTSKLNKTGNICLTVDKNIENRLNFAENSSKLVQQYSQSKNIRTVAATFKAFCIELLKELSVGGGTGGTHFIKCVRSDLLNRPRHFHDEIVKQQLRAMSVLETAQARQRGFTHRVPFTEFLKRYKFLAFDFDENVEMTKDNCRLLLLRLNMEGWIIGKTKVFLKYYNEEYLSRLYEINVKKVIKIQSMIRSYLARRKMAKNIKMQKKVSKITQEENETFTDDQAATIVQKAYRKHMKKRLHSNVIEFSPELIIFIKYFFDKWRNKSIFHVLLQYRAQKFQELYNLSQQVHLYNQSVFNNLQQSDNINLKSVDSKAKVEKWLNSKKQSVGKLPFRLDEVPYFDTSYMCEHSGVTEHARETEDESWDAPYRWRESVSLQITSSMVNSSESTDKHKNQLIEIPYVRSISEPIVSLSEDPPYFEQDVAEEKEISMPETKTVTVPNNSFPEANISTSDNKDVECSKAPVNEKVKTDFKNPIAELENIVKRKSPNSEDDPPFNFQSILRKTNYQRKSIKREQDTEPFYALRKCETHSNIQENVITKLPSVDYNKQNIVVNGSNNSLPLTEITSGIFMQGFIIEL